MVEIVSTITVCVTWFIVIYMMSDEIRDILKSVAKRIGKEEIRNAPLSHYRGAYATKKQEEGEKEC